MRRIEVLSATAPTSDRCGNALAGDLNGQLENWRARHPEASIVETTTRAQCNEHRFMAILTIVFDE